MKLNKFLLSLLIVPALTLSGCSDYEDTEVVSPEADVNAIGANFTSAATKVVAKSGSSTFELSLNRVNTKDAVTIPVTVKACDDVTTGVKFCAQPTAFIFAAGEAKATIELGYNAACEFQKAYNMTLSIGEGKDHPYASGTASTKVSFTIDYTWKKLAQPVILESGWHDGGILAPVEWATDYKDEVTGNMLFRVNALYANVGLGTTGHLQFFLDKDYNPAGMFTSVPAGYDPTAIKTGAQDKDKNSLLLNVTNFAKGTGKDIYVFTYNVYYKKEGVVTNTKTGVTSALDFDFKTPMSKLIK